MPPAPRSPPPRSAPRLRASGAYARRASPAETGSSPRPAPAHRPARRPSPCDRRNPPPSACRDCAALFGHRATGRASPGCARRCDNFARSTARRSPRPFSPMPVSSRLQKPHGVFVGRALVGAFSERAQARGLRLTKSLRQGRRSTGRQGDSTNRPPQTPFDAHRGATAPVPLRLPATFPPSFPTGTPKSGEPSARHRKGWMRVWRFGS